MHQKQNCNDRLVENL